MNIKTVGVIGAGVMGTGVAQNLAQTKHNVVLVDISEKTLNEAKEKIIHDIRFQTMFSKDKIKEAPEDIIARIKFTIDYNDLKPVEFLVENVFENLDAKKKVYEKIDTICKPDCIFAANTSCISITKIAALTNRKEKVIGIHFMNPVYLKHTVEVIKGYHTSKNCIEKTIEFLKQFNKEAIIVNDFPGFVSNRVSHLFMNEAAFVVQDQVASPAQVDEIFVKCYGHKMGPLATADLIGLDTVVNSLDVLYESYNDPKFRCCPLLKKMVDAGLYGRKSGEGFFEYKHF